GLGAAAADAETAPLANPRFFQYRLDLAAITEVWRHGSIISSRLLDLTAEALARDEKLTAFGGRVSDSGEGRWTLEAAIGAGVARQGCDVKWLVNRVRDSLKAFVPGADETVAGRLTELLRYVDGDYNHRATFDKLRRTLGEAQRPLHYLAIPPSMFPAVIEHL